MGVKTNKSAIYITFFLIYEILMISLSTVIVMLSFVDLLYDFSPQTTETIRQLDLTICSVFAIDLIYHLIIAENKKKCIKDSLITIIAIIPFSSLFRIAGILHLNKVFSVIKYTPSGGPAFSRLWIFFMRPAVARITKFFNMARTYFNKRFPKKD